VCLVLLALNGIIAKLIKTDSKEVDNFLEAF
jgi:hypothetical protein